MKQTYSILGMTCSSCEFKIKKELLSLPNIISVHVSLTDKTVCVDKQNTIPFTTIQNAILKAGEKYRVSEITSSTQSINTKKPTTWLETYKPIVLIFTYIFTITTIIQLRNNYFDWMLWMQYFMAGFFLVFSFFKLLNLLGFVESYKMYDVIAKKIPIWGYVYAFLELGLGIAYLIGFDPIVTNSITFIVMTISVIGVLQSVLNNQKIQCACLGAIFNLPMSTVTIIEDALMIVMSGVMIIHLY